MSFRNPQLALVPVAIVHGLAPVTCKFIPSLMNQNLECSSARAIEIFNGYVSQLVHLHRFQRSGPVHTRLMVIKCSMYLNPRIEAAVSLQHSRFHNVHLITDMLSLVCAVTQLLHLLVVRL